jgi:hypothetical protein
MKSNRRQYYGNSINLSGLYSIKPVVCYKPAQKIGEKDNEIYWCKQGNFDIDIKNLGLSSICDGSVIVFTSKNKKDVELWTSGVLSAMRMMKRWCV